MSGCIRSRQFSPHSVVVVTNTPTTGSSMGTKENWTVGTQRIPCLIEPLSSSDDAAVAQPAVLSQKQTKTVYRVNFSSDPGLDPLRQRLKVVSPANYAGRLLRITDPVIDLEWKGQIFQCVCQELSQDRQTIPLMGAAGKKKGGSRGE